MFAADTNVMMVVVVVGFFFSFFLSFFPLRQKCQKLNKFFMSFKCCGIDIIIGILLSFSFPVQEKIYNSNSIG